MIYEKVVKLCEKEKISIAALERKADIGNGVIAKWKDGDPKISTVKKAADALGIDIKELLEG